MDGHWRIRCFRDVDHKEKIMALVQDEGCAWEASQGKWNEARGTVCLMCISCVHYIN